MTTELIPICGEHHVQKEWRTTTFEYSDEGITIRVPNVYAWVCPESGEASFIPDTVDELIATIRELVEIAKRAKTPAGADRIYCFSQVLIRRANEPSQVLKGGNCL